MKWLGTSVKRKIWYFVLITILLLLFQGVFSMVLVRWVERENRTLIVHMDRAQETEEILTSHHEWLSGMLMYLYTGEDFSGSLDYQNCALGKWLQSDYVAHSEDAELNRLVEQILAPHKKIHETAAALVSQFESGTMDRNEANALFLDTIKPDSLTTIDYLKQVVVYERKLARDCEEKLMRLKTTTNIVHFSLLVTAAIAGVLTGVILIRQIIPPIKEVTEAARALAMGDTDIDIKIKSRDEIGQLEEAFAEIVHATEQQVALTEAVASGDLTRSIEARSEQDKMVIALGTMVSHLKDMFEDVNTTAGQVNVTAQQLSASAQNLATGSIQQAAALEALNMRTAEIQSQSQSSAELARHVKDATEEIGEHMTQSMDNMNELTGAMSSIEDRSQAIESVIKVIDDIAFQTNILALNAAVEAARAGKEGKGFAVVADEVRMLAAKSAEAASKTAELIQNSIEGVKNGIELAAKTAESLSSVSMLTQENAGDLDKLNAMSQQTTAAITEINVGMGQISGVVQANSTTAEESAASAEEMSAQSNRLNGIVNRFIVGQRADGNSPSAKQQENAGLPVRPARRGISDDTCR